MAATAQDWEARLNHLPTYHLVQLATLTSYFVDEVRRRWAAGQPVPPRCTKEWIDDLAVKVVRAERSSPGASTTSNPPADRLADTAGQGQRRAALGVASSGCHTAG